MNYVSKSRHYVGRRLQNASLFVIFQILGMAWSHGGEGVQCVLKHVKTATQELVVVQNAPWPRDTEMLRDLVAKVRRIVGHLRDVSLERAQRCTAGIVQVPAYFFMAPTGTNRTFQAHAEVHLAPECRCPLSSPREDRGVGTWLLFTVLWNAHCRHEKCSA